MTRSRDDRAYAECGPDEADTTTTSECSGFYDDAPQVAHLKASAGRAPRRIGIMALEISIAAGHTQCIGRFVVDGELVRVPGTASNAVAPGAAARRFLPSVGALVDGCFEGPERRSGKVL